MTYEEKKELRKALLKTCLNVCERVAAGKELNDKAVEMLPFVAELLLKGPVTQSDDESRTER